MKMTCGEVLLRDRIKAKFGRTATIARAAILTQDHNGRAACHYCGPCERGCITFSYFSSPFTTVADALRSGNCTLFTNAIVSHVEINRKGNQVSGVTYIERNTHKSYQVLGRTVLLCAQALESTRILLNSATREHPNGLGNNSSGVLGHYLMDHCMGKGAYGEFKSFNFKMSANDPVRPTGIYVIRFRNLKGGPRDPRFIRGYHYHGDSRPAFAFDAEGFGASYKDAVKAGIYHVSLHACGESLARFDNYCKIDPELKDAWGIPALHINVTHGPNEEAMMEDAAATAAEMLEAAGATNILIKDFGNTALAMPGMTIHEVGTARMGNDPKKSVLDSYNQTHDIKNLYVLDGACWVSSANQNPTLTMMAITVRACDHLIERFKRNEV
jgi:choline dehydrogenase-like flavoprotein